VLLQWLFRAAVCGADAAAGEEKVREDFVTVGNTVRLFVSRARTKD
jgi:hypothetical protein